MSPKILQYKGISLKFFSKEHNPIHVHANYSHDRGMRIELHGNGANIRVVYKRLKGFKEFAPAQMRDLKALIGAYKEEIAEDWLQAIVLKRRVPSKIINRKIK